MRRSMRPTCWIINRASVLAEELLCRLHGLRAEIVVPDAGEAHEAFGGVDQGVEALGQRHRHDIVALAAQQPVGHLILQSPFTSAADVGAQRYWFVPVGLLMKDQFRSDLRIGKVTAPVLVLHGERDNIVPMALAERLYGLVNAPKRFVRFAGIGHNDLGAEAVEAAKQFLGEH